MLCFSKPKIGKSLLVTQMLHALATGTPFFGHPTTSQRCVLVQADTPPALWQEELAQAAFPVDSPVHTLFVDPGALSGGLEPVLAALIPLRPCYVAFDAIDSLFRGHDINDVDHAKEILRRLRVVAGGRVFLAIHHARKGSPGEVEDLRDAAAGSRILMEQADQVIYLRSPFGPIEITGRLASHVVEKRTLRRQGGGMWVTTSSASASP